MAKRTCSSHAVSAERSCWFLLFSSLLLLHPTINAFHPSFRMGRSKNVHLHSSTPEEWVEGLQQVYRDLDRPDPLARSFIDAPETLEFSFVTPPLPNGTSTWRSTRVVPSNDHPKKPIAVYIPGLDGYGVSACQHQFDDLARTFDLWRLRIRPEDRSSFVQVVSAIVAFAKSIDDEEITLIGESTGGVLATAAACKLRKQGNNSLKGLVLVNPATSFESAPWLEQLVVPALASLGQAGRSDGERQLTPYALLGSLFLVGTIPGNDQVRRLLENLRRAAEAGRPIELSRTIEALLDACRELGMRIPSQVLEHRVKQWLVIGTPIVNARLLQLQQLPVLVVAGRDDRLLPSAQEASRLERLINVEALVVRGRGHYVLDETVNLTEAILYSKIDPLHWTGNHDEKGGAGTGTSKKYDKVLDWRLDEAALNRTLQSTVQTQRAAHSPVFISTDSEGRRWKGLDYVPEAAEQDNNPPVLFVGNHQIAGADMRILVAELYEQRGRYPRGLAHPILFLASQDRPGELMGRTPGMLEPATNLPNADVEQFGAVQVSPRNYYRLLQSGQDALLYPGGSKEAQCSRRDYPLFWPKKLDFVRTAARFNATIIPLSAIGMTDSVNVLAEPEEILKVPFVGQQLEAFSANVSAARYDESSQDEIVGIPLALPALPARNYFLFGHPISLENVDPKDKAACRAIYQQVQCTVRQGLDDLLRARQRDVFHRDIPRRLAYERVTGKAAPTFDMEELGTQRPANEMFQNQRMSTRITDE